MDFLYDLPLAHIPTLAIISAALALNLLFCGEKLMSRAYRSPQNYAARIIDALERRYNREDLLPDVRRSEGRSILMILILVAFLVGGLFESFVTIADYGWIIEAILLSTIFQSRLMLEQSASLSRALSNSVQEGRATLCLISGLDTSEYTESDIARMGTEALTKAFVEGFVGLIFYYWLFDLPGLLIFKMINTSSNMLSESQCSCTEFGTPAHKANTLLMRPVSYIAALLLLIVAAFTNIKVKQTIQNQSGNISILKEKTTAHATAMMAAILNIKLGLPPEGAGSPIGDETHLARARRLVLVASYALWATWMVLHIAGLPSPAKWLFHLFT